MADDWKSYIDLDGTHVHMAANSPTTVAEDARAALQHDQREVPGG